MDRLVTPRPHSTGAMPAVPAISPHTPTSIPFSFAALAVMAIRRSTPGSQRTVQVGNLLVDAVHRAGVLNQVIRADREEVNLLRQHIRADSRHRNLDHNADLDVRVEGYTFRGQHVLRLLEHLLCITHLIHRRNHREHDTQITVLRGTQQRAKLNQKQLRLIQANADRAVAEERILFLLQRQCGHFLVAADVQRADDNRLACMISHAFL